MWIGAAGVVEVAVGDECECRLLGTLIARERLYIPRCGRPILRVMTPFHVPRLEPMRIRSPICVKVTLTATTAYNKRKGPILAAVWG